MGRLTPQRTHVCPIVPKPLAGHLEDTRRLARMITVILLLTSSFVVIMVMQMVTPTGIGKLNRPILIFVNIGMPEPAA